MKPTKKSMKLRSLDGTALRESNGSGVFINWGNQQCSKCGYQIEQQYSSVGGNRKMQCPSCGG